MNTTNVKIGDTITINLSAEIIDMSNAHGTCYLIELPQKDYNHKRTIWIDEDEAFLIGVKKFS